MNEWLRSLLKWTIPVQCTVSVQMVGSTNGLKLYGWTIHRKSEHELEPIQYFIVNVLDFGLVYFIN